jgi:O-methyltransferase involved in polyketide biosynthesis
MAEAGSPDVPFPAPMTSHPADATAFIQADLREPGWILADPELHATLDLSKPVALMLVAVLHFLAETQNPRGIVAELVSALPSGSYLAVSHLTADFDPGSAAAAQVAGQRSGVTYVPRSNAEVTAFLTSLGLVDPGVVPLLAWRPDDGTPEDTLAVRSYAAMGRKP